jgi:1-acyl-sn-glycerol-3-phosphate acyltransferase
MPARVRSLDSRRRSPRQHASAAAPGARKVVRPVAKLRPAPETTAPGTAPERPARALELLREAARLTWDAINPDVIGAIDREVRERLRRVPTKVNSYGYDPWGLHVEVVRRATIVSTLIYRYYFRVEAHGLEHLPAGRVLVIGNHAGQIALDAAMIGTAAFLEGEPPRIVRGMGEYWLPTVPFVSEMMVRTGSVVGTPKNCIDLLRNEEAVIAFPEGVRGMNKLFTQRYQLQRFGYGFMRLALATQTPIVPVAVVGSEEQAPGIANLVGLGHLLGMPSFPITLTWPWLGPLGLLPLPVKYRIYFGAPLTFSGDPDDEDAAIGQKVEQVRQTIQSMLDRGVRERPGIFF